MDQLFFMCSLLKKVKWSNFGVFQLKKGPVFVFKCSI